MELPNHFQFGPFSLDASERVLLRDGRVVPLAPKALSTLLVLVRNMGHVVEKDVLMNEVWPDEFVEEGNLAQHIFMLRKVLGEANGNANYIETIPRRGYRFVVLGESYNVRRTYAVGVNSLQERHVTKPPADATAGHREYLQGRYHWSRHTREGLEQAINHFRKVITQCPTHVLAYAGIVDSYLRLATNYFPPQEALATAASPMPAGELDKDPQVRALIDIKCEWDQLIAEKEHKRTVELQSDDLTLQQWHAAYLFSRRLHNDALTKTNLARDWISNPIRNPVPDLPLPAQPQYSNPTLAEDIQVSCVVARAQIDAGNYDAAGAVLERWWTISEWPKLDGLSPHSSGDLLFTAGALAGDVASTRLVPGGQKHAEALLSGAIGIFEQLGLRTLTAEARLELARCYHREGLFDLARTTLLAALKTISAEERDLRSLALIRLATVECHAGRLRDSLARLNEAAEIVDLAGPWYHLELAITHQNLAVTQGRTSFLIRQSITIQERWIISRLLGTTATPQLLKITMAICWSNWDDTMKPRPIFCVLANYFDGFADKCDERKSMRHWRYFI